MSDKELIAQLRAGPGHDRREAADCIEALVAKVEKLAKELASGSFYKESDIDALQNRAEAAEAKVEKLVEALRELHHAVCGETGFAECVRKDSGTAYPWPALDASDDKARAALAEIEGDQK